MKKDTLMIVAGLLVLGAIGIVIYNRRKKAIVSGNAVVRMGITEEEDNISPDFSEKKQTEINFTR